MTAAKARVYELVVAPDVQVVDPATEQLHGPGETIATDATGEDLVRLAEPIRHGWIEVNTGGRRRR